MTPDAPVRRLAFDVPAVTSVSMDLHKYAFAAKGASVLLHRSAALRRHQMYACANWTGYTIVNRVTVPHLQVKDGQYTRPKGLDGVCPCGPATVHAARPAPGERPSPRRVPGPKAAVNSRPRQS